MRYLALALALFAAGYLAGTCGKPTSAELDAAEDARREAVAHAEEAERARAAVEVQATAEIVEAEVARDSALAVARAAESRRPTVIERVVERAGADSAVVRIAVEEVVDSLVLHEIGPLRAALVAQEAAFTAQGRLLDAEREARVAAQDGFRAALAEIEVLRGARPGWFERNGTRLLVIAGPPLGWWLRGQVGP